MSQMSNKTKQLKYNQAIDNLTYLVLNYPKPVQEILAEQNVFFQGKPSKEQLINEVVEQLKDGNPVFAKALENLILGSYCKRSSWNLRRNFWKEKA